MNYETINKKIKNVKVNTSDFVKRISDNNWFIPTVAACALTIVTSVGYVALRESTPDMLYLSGDYNGYKTAAKVCTTKDKHLVRQICLEDSVGGIVSGGDTEQGIFHNIHIDKLKLGDKLTKYANPDSLEAAYNSLFIVP